MPRRLVSTLSVLVTLSLTTAIACSVTEDFEPLQSGACPTGQKACNASCVSTNSPQTGCGLANVCSPCSLGNATARCAPNGTCEIAACTAGWANCDANSTNGCEIQTDFDVNHCGGCETKCAPPNATPGCAAGACTVRACKEGFGNCDQNVINGCEATLASDRANCGACGKACGAGEACVAGACVGEGIADGGTD